MTVSDSVFAGNSATFGGGIYNNADDTLIINDSLFIDNSSTTVNNYGGGGIFNGGALNVSNSIFACNSSVSGGGIYNLSYLGTLTTTNDFFFNNTGSN